MSAERSAIFEALEQAGATIDNTESPDLLAPNLACAAFSEDRRYRYALGRTWGEGPAVAFVMLNPSTADAFKVDPTVRRCLGFARAWGFETLIVLNLFALRSTDPKALYSAEPGFDPVGPLNDLTLDAVPPETRIVAAWGVHGALDGRGQIVHERLVAAGHDVQCLGKRTREGHPRHPLYLRGDVAVEPMPHLGGVQ